MDPLTPSDSTGFTPSSSSSDSMASMSPPYQTVFTPQFQVSTPNSSTASDVYYRCPGSQNGGDMQAMEFAPRDVFWDDIPFPVANAALQAFSQNDLLIMPTRATATEPRAEKLQFLAKCLKKKMMQQEATAFPSSFAELDPAGWHRVMVALVSVQRELGDLQAVEGTLRLMIDERVDKSDKSHHYSLALLLLERGKYAGAEKAAIEVETWLVYKLGRDHPQTLSTKRIRILATWKQGRSRHPEAERLLTDLRDCVIAMGYGPYAAYQQNERNLIPALMAQMD